jgi:SNF2 family DNA or RNA helicase
LFVSSVKIDDHFALSGKMKVLHDLLTTIKRQRGRVLLFSFSTQTLDRIENYVKTRGHDYLRMDGSTGQKECQKMLSKFKSDDDVFVFLLSTKAMGLGLNITEANNVIIFDVDWNPSADGTCNC